MNEFSAPEQSIVNDNDVDEHYAYFYPDEIDEMNKILDGVDVDDDVQINSLDDALKFMDKIFEALGAFAPVDQPEPPTTSDQPHQGQSNAIADVLREPEALGFHDGVYYWEPWHVESDFGNPPEATD